MKKPCTQACPQSILLNTNIPPDLASFYPSTITAGGPSSAPPVPRSWPPYESAQWFWGPDQPCVTPNYAKSTKTQAFTHLK